MIEIINIEYIWDELTNAHSISPLDILAIKRQQKKLLSALENDYDIVDMHCMDCLIEN